MPAKRKNTRKKASSQKSADPSLKLVLKRLDDFDQRFDALDRKIDAVDQKVDAVRKEVAAEFKAVREETAAEFKTVRGEIAQSRQETAAEFKAVRGEMAQGFDSLRHEFKNDMAQGFDSFRREFNAEMQKELEQHGASIYQHILHMENELKAEHAEFRSEHRELLTGMDEMAKNYENYLHDRAVGDAEIRDLQRNVETLKKRDMEKAAAIDKIEKEIDKLKAA